jgi:HPt (histidine-containing phosphotransfer) domain-containing protein
MPDAPVDQDALLDLVDGDTVFLERLIETFRRDCKAYLRDIRSAIDRGDAEALVNEAHGLKGAAAHLQAESVRAAARRLEEVGRKGELDRAPELAWRLERAVNCLLPALEEMVEET